MMRTIGLVLLCTVVSWSTADLHDYMAARQAVWQSETRPFGQPDNHDFQVADYFTPFGGLTPGDGNTVCSTGTATSACNPFAVGTSTFAHTSTNATANGVGYSFAAASLTGTANTANGVVQIIPPAANVAAIQLGNAGAIPNLIESNAGASTDQIILNTIGTCTSGNKMFDIEKAGADNFKMLCNGNITYSVGILTVSGGSVIVSGNGGLVEETPTLGSNNITTEAIPQYQMSAGGVATIETNTLHAIRGFCAFSSSTTCNTSTQVSGAVWGIVFAGIGDMFCSVTPTSTSGAVSVSTYAVDHIIITAGNSNSSAVPYWCIGI